MNTIIICIQHLQEELETSIGMKKSHGYISQKVTKQMKPKHIWVWGKYFGTFCMQLTNIIRGQRHGYGEMCTHTLFMDVPKVGVDIDVGMEK